MNEFFAVVGKNATNAVSNFFSRTVHVGSFSLYYSLSEKLSGESFLIDSDTYVLFFDGLLFDVGTAATGKEYISQLLACEPVKNVVRKLNGSFRGIVFDKVNGIAYAFTDHLATRKIYYATHHAPFAVSTRSFFLAQFLKSKGGLTLDISSIYGFLGFGYFLDKYTHFSEINKLPVSTILEYPIGDHPTLNVERYSTLYDPSLRLRNSSEIVEEVERIFSQSIERIAYVNKHYNLRSASALSAGLDSKTVTISLFEKEVPNNLALTFARWPSMDFEVPLKVASDLHIDHLSFDLDDGAYLTRYAEEYLQATDGMLPYQTAIHGYSMLRNVSFENVGIYASGQIGDVLLGPKPICDTRECLRKYSYIGVAQPVFYERPAFLNDLLSNYLPCNWLAFNLEQRQSNGTLMGDVFVRQMVETVSPFVNKDLIGFCLAIPNELKRDNQIYIAWLKKYHPRVLDYKWSGCGCRPTLPAKVKLGVQMTRVSGFIHRKLGLAAGMNPFDYWLKNNLSIQEYLDTQFAAGLSALTLPADLRRDLEQYYRDDALRGGKNKFAAVTLLMSIHWHLHGEIYRGHEGNRGL